MNLWKRILKSLWWFLGAVLACYGLSKMFKETRLFNLNIPDWIFFLWLLFFSIVLLIAVHYVSQDRGAAEDGGLKKEIEGLKKGFEDYRKGVNKLEIEFREKINKQDEILARIHNAPKEYLKLEPNDEILFILETLANQRSQSMDWRDLESYYKKKFDKLKTQADYNIVINKLMTHRYIRLNEIAEPEEYEITPKGLEYFALIGEKK